MLPSSSSLPPLLLLLLLLLLRPGGAAEDADGSDAFTAGKDDFVLDTEYAVKKGAALVATAHVRSATECERACGVERRCNLALLEPRADAVEDDRTCVLFNCVYRNHFVCTFVNEEGYQSYIRGSVFKKYLEAPQGPGEEALPIAVPSRDVVVQPGATVTLNSTESRSPNDGHITDYRWTLQSGDSGVQMEKTDEADQVRLSNLQTGVYVFQLTVTNSNGQSHNAKVTVTVLDPEQTKFYCLDERKVGPCRALFPRWFYDAAAGRCERFGFGGCKENKNNYLSEDACLSACDGVTASSPRADPLPPAEVCGSACRLDQLTCDNGCCLHRSLECDGMTHCSDGSDESHCSTLNQTFSRLLDIDVNERNARCTEPPRTGPCRASHTRWFYNPLEGKCFTFTYGGCDGNKNNFEKDAKCRETCDGVTKENVYFRGLFDRFEKEDDGDSGSIALAVVLSVAILSLLAILTYCFLKARRERSHRPVATGPAHVALSEQDMLVYNSTTKPV